MALSSSKQFRLKKSLLSQPVFDFIIANSQTIRLFQAVRINEAGFIVPVASGEKVDGIVTGLIDRNGMPVGAKRAQGLDGSIVFGDDQITVSSTNQTNDQRYIKAKVFLDPMGYFLWENTADDNLPTTNTFLPYDVGTDAGQITADKSKTIGQFDLLQRDPDGDGNLKKGLFRIIPNYSRSTVYSPATFTVAPANAGQKADFYTDGTNDNVEIQMAIDSLPSSGGKVLLYQGTYSIGQTIILDSYQRLEGLGKGTILKAKNNFNSDIIGSQTDTYNRYIEVCNLTIDGNRANNTDGRGINFYAPRNCLLEHLWIKETDSDAIYFHGDATNLGWYNYITQCEVDNCDNGIKISGYCEHNYILRNTITFVLGVGIFCDTDVDHIIGNQLDACTDVSINCEFGAGLWTIAENHIDRPGYGSAAHAIVLRSAHGSKVINNTFGECSANKALICNGPNGNDASNYVLCSGNIMTVAGGSGSVGILELTATDRCRYTDNIIYGPATAVTVHASSTNNTNSNTT